MENYGFVPQLDKEDLAKANFLVWRVLDFSDSSRRNAFQKGRDLAHLAFVSARQRVTNKLYDDRILEYWVDEKGAYFAKQNSLGVVENTVNFKEFTEDKRVRPLIERIDSWSMSKYDTLMAKNGAFAFYNFARGLEKRSFAESEN